MINRDSYSCTVFSNATEAREHGLGAIWYVWGDGRSFPQDVKIVWIVMNYTDCDNIVRHTPAPWTMDENATGDSWTLSGTREQPTLSPSLDWEHTWHGELYDGECISF